MRFILFITVATTILSSCMSSIRMQVLKPADVTIPTSIKKIGLVNRAIVSKDNKALNIFEGILTGEGLFADREGSKTCINGLKSGLEQSPKYEISIPADVVLKQGTGIAKFPPPMDWDEINDICNKYGVDAIIVLEAFDSNTDRTVTTKPIKVKNKEGIYVDQVEFHVNMHVEIRTGWRIYDNLSKKMIDEWKQTDVFDYGGVGGNEASALLKCGTKQANVMNSGITAGNRYAFRISPQWIWVSRNYYKSGSPSMRIAKKHVRRGFWTEATQLWKQETTNSNRKIAARAMFNMALSCEQQGELELALDWAKQSYKTRPKNMSSSYIYTIQNRINDSKKLEIQMEGK